MGAPRKFIETMRRGQYKYFGGPKLSGIGIREVRDIVNSPPTALG
jgi:hypothetical protein